MMAAAPAEVAVTARRNPQPPASEKEVENPLLPAAPAGQPPSGASQTAELGPRPEGVAATPATSPAPAAATPTAPPPPQSTPTLEVVQQVREGLRMADPGMVELALSPEELGRVQITMSGDERVLTVSIQAERADTGDLLRRHISLLGQELRDMGYGSVSFEFGTGAQRDQRTASPDAIAQAPPTETSEAPQRPPAPAPQGGLDLRL